MIPFALFVNSRTDRATGWLYTLLFSLLLVPKPFIVIAHETSLNSILNPIIMIVLLTHTLFAAWNRKTNPLFDFGCGPSLQDNRTV